MHLLQVPQVKQKTTIFALSQQMFPLFLCKEFSIGVAMEKKRKIKWVSITAVNGVRNSKNMKNDEDQGYKMIFRASPHRAEK